MNLNSIAFIPDGNRRFAGLMNISLAEAYSLGTQKAWQVIDWISKYKEIKFGTFYTLSLENLQRNNLELHILFKLFENELIKVKNSDFFQVKGIKLKFIGRIDLLPKSLQKLVSEAEKQTSQNTEKQINLAIGYNGQQEIVDAAKKIAEKFKNNELNLNDLKPENFKNYLYEDFPFPDLIIRTSGVERLSAFLTYQSSYSELEFINKYWPELSEQDLNKAISNYYTRKRTFGL